MAVDGPHAGEGRFTRSLGLLHVTASGVSIIVGAGIFVLLGPATEQAGALVWLGFLVAAGLCALTAASYMELASMFPRAGSEFEFARQVFPSWVAFAVGWSMAAALVVASSTVAVGFARYAGYFVTVDGRIVASAALLAGVGVSWRGMGSASRLIVALAAVQVLGLVAVVAVGVPSLGDVDLFDGRGFGGVLGAAALVFFAYIGFDEVVTLSEETRNPRRTIPLALVLSLAISSLLYVAVSASAVGVLGPDVLAVSERPLADVAAVAVGSAATGAVSVLALVSTFTTVVLAATAASRMIYSLASEGFLPARFAAVSRGRTPRAALAVVGSSALGLAVVGDLGVLASATDALVFVMFVVTNLVLVVLRIRRPDAERPFRVPWSWRGIPLPSVMGLGVTLVLMSRLHAEALALAGVLVAVGAAVGIAVGRRADGMSRRD